jgi:nucleotide-binding universal stress UspA family protein
MKNILVPVDFEGATTFLLLAEAYKMAKQFNAKIWLLHVATPNPEFVGYEVGPQYIRDKRASELKIEHLQIKKFTDELKGKGVEAEGLLIFGSTVEMIQLEAKKLKIDLIMIGHHNRGFVYNLFYGSTDLQLMEKLAVPLMIIPMDWGKN